MKRDLDLVRKILFAIEESDEIKFSFYRLPKIDGYATNKIMYHMKIMAQAGLLFYEKEIDEREFPNGHRSTIKQKFVTEDYSISRLGHEFLDAMRDINRWGKVKSIMTNTGEYTLLMR